MKKSIAIKMGALSLAVCAMFAGTHTSARLVSSAESPGGSASATAPVKPSSEENKDNQKTEVQIPKGVRVESPTEANTEKKTGNTTNPIPVPVEIYTVEDIVSNSVNKMSTSVFDTGLFVVEDLIKPKPVEVKNAKTSLASVTCIEVTWDAEKNREYDVAWSACAEYTENIQFVYNEPGKCYITGLRIDTEYEVSVIPKIKEGENLYPVEFKTTVKTPNPEVIEEFPHEEGWTSCFAGERASGLTAMPSSGAIYGSTCDSITGTGIRRHANGDYACAMGLFYGQCGDRFLIELENGIQFTTRICDSKGWCDDADQNGWIGDDIDRDLDGDGNKDADGDGICDGRFHWFGGPGNGKCVIEFIYHDGALPGCVAFSGSWGGRNWNGLDLSANIRSIKKLANYDT